MPLFTPAQLQGISETVLTAAGVEADDASIVARELVDANLLGHDSHGVMRLMQYVDHMRDGIIRPGAPLDVVLDRPAVAIVDGNSNFGQITATRALRVAMEKAAADSTATVMIRNCNHVGRLGSYVDKAARAGFACLMAVNAPGRGGVAPYGGRERRLGTNPISMAAPWGDEALVLDMTTSAVAEGKLRVAYQKGESIPTGWIIDAQGNPSTNPGDFYADPGGALLPLGGALGFKGFGLAVMLDVFCGALSGSGLCRDDVPPGVNGVWLYLLKIEDFLPTDKYQKLIGEYVAFIKGCPKLPGVEEILMPGEIERRRQAAREKEGVPLPDNTWKMINELATRLGTSVAEL